MAGWGYVMNELTEELQRYYRGFVKGLITPGELCVGALDALALADDRQTVWDEIPKQFKQVVLEQLRFLGIDGVPRAMNIGLYDEARLAEATARRREVAAWLLMDK